jgi:hypothetical protein
MPLRASTAHRPRISRASAADQPRINRAGSAGGVNRTTAAPS